MGRLFSIFKKKPPTEEEPGQLFRIETSALNSQGKQSFLERKYLVACSKFDVAYDNVQAGNYPIEDLNLTLTGSTGRNDCKLALELKISSGLCLAFAGRYPEACDKLFPFFAEYIKKCPNKELFDELNIKSNDVLYEVGKAAASKSKHGDAITYLEKLTENLHATSDYRQEHPQRYLEVQLLLGKCCYMVECPKKALRTFETADTNMEGYKVNHETRKVLASCHAYQGTLYYIQGDLVQAKKYLGLAIPFTANSIYNHKFMQSWSVHQWYAETLLELNDPLEARESLMTVVKNSVKSLCELKTEEAANPSHQSQWHELSSILSDVITRVVQICYATGDIDNTNSDIAQTLLPFRQEQYANSAARIIKTYHEAVITARIGQATKFLVDEDHERTLAICNAAMLWHRHQNCHNDCHVKFVEHLSRVADVSLNGSIKAKLPDAPQSSTSNGSPTYGSAKALPSDGHASSTSSQRNDARVLEALDLVDGSPSHRPGKRKPTLNLASSDASSDFVGRRMSTISQDSQISDKTIKASAAGAQSGFNDENSQISQSLSASARQLRPSDSAYVNSSGSLTDISENNTPRRSSSEFDPASNQLWSPYDAQATPMTSRSTYSNHSLASSPKAEHQINSKPMYTDGSLPTVVNFSRAASNTTSQVSSPTGKSSLNSPPTRRLRQVVEASNLPDQVQSLVINRYTDLDLPITNTTRLRGISQDVRNKLIAQSSSILDTTIYPRPSGSGLHHFNVKNYNDSFELETNRGSDGHLGSSGGGVKVIAARHRENNQLYAIKLVPRGTADDKGKQMANELYTYGSLKPYKHIIEYCASFTDEKYIGLVMSTVADKNLDDLLADAGEEDFPLIRRLFGCLINAVVNMHSQGVVNKDIKPKNLLLKNGVVYIGDFGTSRNFGTTGVAQTNNIGPHTPEYASPEQLNGHYKGTPTDLFSLGRVFLEMFVVLKGRSVKTLYEDLRKNGHNVKGLHFMMDDLEKSGSGEDNVILSWLRDMLIENPEARKSAAQIRELIYSSQSQSKKSYHDNCCA